MFCDSLNDPTETRPNVNVCPVCLGHPGTLPTINKKAVEHVIRVGLALGGNIAERTKFDRKNYFYPDLPKGYQISQYDQPLVSGGKLHKVRLTRIHLEEDAGRLLHGGDTFAKGGSTLVDYNRASVPLMELVTEPDIRSADEAVAFAKELQLILRTLGVSDADMEKGLMRIEANVSLDMGTKTELKNINSFRAVHDAVEYELKRQAEVLAKGEKVVQETRGWDEVRRVTVSQRSKEEAHDYRYFPDPDLPPFDTSVFEVERLRAEMPELPALKRERLVKEYGVTVEQADSLVHEPELGNYFEAAVSELQALDASAPVATLYNYLSSDLKGLLNEFNKALPGALPPEHLAHLVSLVSGKKLTSRQAKDLLRMMVETGLDPETIMRQEDMGTSADAGAIEAIVQDVIAQNDKAVADYRKGKEASLQFLVGKAMAALKGKADPETLRAMFITELTK
jgi:aspartyl-tRNA(Asn)/glutamyl-tRNA(Gln) amidotransferase subunit B